MELASGADPLGEIFWVVGVVAARAMLLEQILWLVVYWTIMVLSVGQASNYFWEVDIWATMVKSVGQANSNIWVVDKFSAKGIISETALGWMVYMAMARGLVFLYTWNMLGVVYMSDMNVGLFLYKLNHTGYA